MHYGGGPGGGHLLGAHDISEDEGLGKVYDQQIVGRLLKYLAPVKLLVALGASGMVIRSLASLAYPYLVAIGIDRFIVQGNLSGLNIIAIAFVGAALLGWAGQYTETLSLSYAGQAVLLRLRTQMFDHLQRLSLSFFDRNEVGKIMSRVQNDVQQLQQLLTTGFLGILTSVLTVVGIACVMISMNARLALLTLAVVPVLGLVVVIWQKYARHAFLRVRRAIAVVNAGLQENISGVRVIQSLSREDVNFEQFDIVNKAHLGANIKATKLSSVMLPVVEILVAVATALIIVFGGYQVLAGAMGVGVLLGFLLYIQRFFNPIRELAMQYTQLQRAMASGSRIFELLDTEPEIQDDAHAVELPPIKGEIQFHHVSFGYQPDVEVLHDIDLTVYPGETVAIVGKTGAGKSTLMNLLCRFYEIEKGKVTVDGYDVRLVTRQSLMRQMSIVPQDPFLFSGSIEDNIRYGRFEASHQEVIEAARTVGAHNFITQLEHGYDTPVEERGSNLSVGQRQLICLARAVLANPRILVLDEATSNVDTRTETLIRKALRSLLQGRTCFLIAHRLSTVTNADRIVVLDQGRIIEIGTHQELLAKRGLYYHMFGALSAPNVG